MKPQSGNPLKWVPSLYFAMGLPFVVLNMVAVIMFKDLGVADAQIAFWTSLIMWPWTIKFLWSPFLEIFRTKKFFVVTTQLLSGILFGFAALALHLPTFFAVGIALFAVIAFSGATHDIAADGVYMSELDEKNQAKYIGWQGAFYNLAKLIATGGLVWLAGWLYKNFAGENPSAAASFEAYVQAWTIIFAIFCVVLVVLGLYHSRVLPSSAVVSNEKHSLKEGMQSLKEVIAAFFTKKHIWYYITFIILYRLGEGFAMKIAPLFLKADVTAGGMGLSNEQIGIYYGTFGSGAFLLGSLLAGYYIAHRGLKRTLFTLCCIFNIPFVVYALLAAFQPSSMWLIGGGIILEYFGYGFGFVGLTLFMMQQIAPGKHQMAHYAFASGIMNLSVMVTGAISGYLSDFLGYERFFLLVLFFTLPAFLITWFIPFTHGDEKDQNKPRKTNKGFRILLWLALFIVEGVAAWSLSNHVLPRNVLPQPQGTNIRIGSLDLKEPLQLSFETPDKVAQSLSEYIASTPLSCQTQSSSDHFLRFILTDKGERIPTSEEGYRLVVSTKGITISSRAEAGLFYGLQTLLQLAKNAETITAQDITDAPRFPYRGLMLDVSRNFRSVEFVMKQIDMLASLKLNRLHLHLVDGAGWRIQIDRYPELCQKAAWRKGQTWVEWQDQGKQYLSEDDPEAKGGYYTKDDIRQIVAYAAKRYITVIPEIEVPGHSDEVLAVYPELSCTGKPYVHGEFCIGNEKTFEFIENVLTEVMELFPSKYIHIGGDEAGKGAWKVCPKCQQRMQDENLQSVDELQSYTIKRVERFLNKHGRKLLGWDEILEGGLADDATVMSWRGEEGGRKAAMAGHDVVMTPGSHCYFDGYQDNPETEPMAMSGFLPIAKVYSYNPVPSFTDEEIAKALGIDLKQDVSEKQAKERMHEINKKREQISNHILGVQANLWTEFVPTAEHCEYMLYPRLFALAEVAWSKPEVKDYADFHRRALLRVQDAKADGYHTFDLSNEFGERKESLEKSDHLAVGCPVSYVHPYHEKYAAEGDQTLTDGQHGSWSYGTRWQGFLSCDVDVTIDLGSVKPLTEVGADFIQWESAWVWLPKQVEISLCSDNETFRTVAVMDHNIPTTDRHPRYMRFKWTGKDEARYVRLKAISNGKTGGWLFTDEIEVR